MKLADRVSRIQSSATLDITSKAKAMQKTGEKVVILAAGEPDFDTPLAIKEAAIKAIKDGYTKYTPASGTISLKKAICQKLKRDNNLEYTPDEVVVSNGAKHSIYNVLQVICSPGDEIIIISPYWLSYPEMVRMADGRPVILKTSPENGFKVSLRDLEKAITPKTRALIINSPSNPAGVVYTEDELREIAGLCVKKDIFVISDEIYEKIIFDGIKHFSIAASSKKARDITIVINGVSKSHAMTGWRIGYMAADKRIAQAASALQSQVTSNPCSISQAAAECALTLGSLEEEVTRNRAEYEARRDFLIGALEGEKRIKPFRPQGAFYLFCDIRDSGLDSAVFSARLLDEKKVAVIPGWPFGEKYYARLSFAADLETIKKGAKRICEWMKTV